MKPAPNWIEAIDWKLLRQQKLRLKESGHDGIVHLLDVIQDWAADELGYSEERVFGFAPSTWKEQ